MRRPRHQPRTASRARRAVAGVCAALYLVMALSAGLAFRPADGSMAISSAADSSPASGTPSARVDATTLEPRLAAALCHGGAGQASGGGGTPTTPGAFPCPACLLGQNLAAPLPPAAIGAVLALDAARAFLKATDPHAPLLSDRSYRHRARAPPAVG